MLNLKEKLGNRIRQLRKRNHLTQEKLAEIMDMDTPNLSNIERGKRFMTAETLEKFAVALKISERELFDFSEIQPELYYKTDIVTILKEFDQKDLEFILNVIKAYKKIKSSC